MTKLVTCDSQVSSLTAALNSASPSEKAALAAALATAGIGGGAPTGAAGGGLTGTYPNPGLDAAAVNAAVSAATIKAALTASGVGTGAFIAQAAGAAIPDATETTLASWTATKTGVVSASFSFAAQTNSPTAQLLSVAKIYKGTTQVAGSGNAAGDTEAESRNAFAEATNQYIAVTAGDVITGKGFVGTSPSVASTTISVAGVGLSLHYISVA